MDVQKLNKVRKDIKKRKPNYKRVQSNQYARFKDDKWRRPKGKGNKDRRNRRGKIGTLKVGYGSPSKIRGFNRLGFEEVIISNIAELSNIDKKVQMAVISSKVGGRKKIGILTEAKKQGVSISNVKDVDLAIKSLVKEKKETPAKKEKLKKEDTSKSAKAEDKSDVKKETKKEDKKETAQNTEKKSSAKGGSKE